VSNKILAASLIASLCASLSAGLATAAPAHATTSGVVADAEGAYANALVCVDRKGNGRCEPGAARTHTDAEGRYKLRGDVAVTVQIDARTRHVVGAKPLKPKQDLVLRAPAGSAFATPVSTELVAMGEALGGVDAARQVLAARLQLDATALDADPRAAGPLQEESRRLMLRIADATAAAGRRGDLAKALSDRLALDRVENVVVIYAENRSFDNLFGHFPGADGLDSRAAKAIRQLDRDGRTVLPKLPPAWGGLTARGQTPVVSQAQTTNVWPNAPFRIDTDRDAFGYGTVPRGVITRDLYHRFFENAMQINGGRNDLYAAWGDSGGAVMGYFDASGTRLWALAKEYTLADRFFQGAFGGSFLNHQYLICACAPAVPAEAVTANKMSLNVLGPDRNGVPQLLAAAGQKDSALDGPALLQTGNIAPLDYFGTGDGYRAVNTMQPAYQPSGNKPAGHDGHDALYADPRSGTTLPPLKEVTIGDLLGAKGIGWTWFSGGWNAASANPWPYDAQAQAYGKSTTIYYANANGTGDAEHTDFQSHHQPFNYYASLDPVAHADARAAHLKDRDDLLALAQAGKLPAVSFYKPVGWLNQHPGYASIDAGDEEIAGVVDALRASPQWSKMLIVVTYDEFGGQFDHARVPQGDRLGPGTRIPAIIISPFARKGYVDHTPYDTASVLRFITDRWSLPELAGLAARDSALAAHGERPMGDLTNALAF